MAKGIRERLLKQAIKFHQWQEATYPGKTSEELGGEWEVDYPYWNDTYSAFCHVLTQMDAETADSVLLDEMVYLGSAEWKNMARKPLKILRNQGLCGTMNASELWQRAKNACGWD